MKRKPNRKHVPTIVQDYLMALVATGLYGATVEEVGYRLICEGIQHKIRDGIIPRRWVQVTYPRMHDN
jgi:hypothetical protein